MIVTVRYALRNANIQIFAKFDSFREAGFRIHYVVVRGSAACLNFAMRTANAPLCSRAQVCVKLLFPKYMLAYRGSYLALKNSFVLPLCEAAFCCSLGGFPE